MEKSPDLLELSAQVGLLLHAQKIKVCTAESCTGGYLAQILTAIPGSSAWFECGWVTYSNTAKEKLLAVPAALIAEQGAVSAAVAAAMAQGALALSDADLSIAITGIAGPSGGLPGKPVGTVWFAWQLRAGETITHSEHFLGDRQAVRRLAVSCALKQIMQLPLIPFLD